MTARQQRPDLKVLNPFVRLAVFKPFAEDDEFGSRGVNPAELYHNQVRQEREGCMAEGRADARTGLQDTFDVAIVCLRRQETLVGCRVNGRPLRLAPEARLVQRRLASPVRAH